MGNKNTMYLIQILLPLYSEDKQMFPEILYDTIRKELTEKFGGITAYSRAPATGLWKETEERTVKDEIIIYEIMTGQPDKTWWKAFKERMEVTFRQQEIVLRMWEMEVL